jgi:hypothetical protein
MSYSSTLGLKRQLSALSRAHDPATNVQVGSSLKQSEEKRVCRVAPLGASDGGELELSDNDDDCEVPMSMAYKKDGSVAVPEPKLFHHSNILQRAMNQPVSNIPTGGIARRPVSAIGRIEQPSSIHGNLNRPITAPTYRSNGGRSGQTNNILAPALTAYQVLHSKEHKDVKLVGGSLISTSKLLANSEVSGVTTISSKAATVTANRQGVKVLPITGIDLLMSKEARRMHDATTVRNIKKASSTDTRQADCQQQKGVGVSAHQHQMKAAKEKELLEMEINQLLGRKSTHADVRMILFFSIWSTYSIL